MSFIYLLVKACAIKRLLDNYKREKRWAIEINGGELPELTCCEKYQRFWRRVNRNIRYSFSKIFSCPPDSSIHHFMMNLKTYGTFENYILKSAIGFLGGVVMTYFLFMFFLFQLNINLKTATIFCFFIGITLTMGLAFSMKCRCIVFLLVPVFFSKHGRQALIAYAFILVMTGPAKNTLHNMGVLSEALACGQESLKKAAAEIVEMIKQPFIALKAAIKNIMVTVKKVIKKLKDMLLAIKRAVMAILGVFKAAGEWLGSIFNICSKKVGTPFERCEKSFDGAILDCSAKLGPMFNWLCSIAYLTKLVCYVVKPFDFVCMLMDVVGAVAGDAIAGIKRKLNEFVSHLRGIFFVKVDFQHSFHFETNQSRGAEEITAGMVTEIKQRTNKILMLFDWMSWTFSLFFLFILLRVWHYRHKYLTSDRFDNHYITDRFRDLDMRRAKLDQETVLPLNRREARKYIPISSPLLVYSERVKLTKSVVFLGVTSFKLLIHIVMDYSLYWVLAKIRFHGRFQSDIAAPPNVHVKVEGEGAVSDIYKSTVKAFSPMEGSTRLDSVPCLPDPLPPNLSRYTQIVSLILIAWLVAFVEPYGLRMRQVVMSFYHPERAAQRAVWLYNNVVRARGSFLKFARRQLRRVAMGADDVERITCKDRLKAQFPLLGRLLGTSGQEACLLCAHVVREGDPEVLVRCQRPGCIGKFCVSCYADLLNVCTICQEPVEYGDLSDQDEEVDSSDEERIVRRRPRPAEGTRGERDVEKGLLDESDASGSSTDVSYGYQKEKFADRRGRSERSPARAQWRDVERQYQGEPASLRDFHPSADTDADADDDETSTTQADANKMGALLGRSAQLGERYEAQRRRGRASGAAGAAASGGSYETDDEMSPLELRRRRGRLASWEADDSEMSDVADWTPPEDREHKKVVVRGLTDFFKIGPARRAGRRDFDARLGDSCKETRREPEDDWGDSASLLETPSSLQDTPRVYTKVISGGLTRFFKFDASTDESRYNRTNRYSRQDTYSRSLKSFGGEEDDYCEDENEDWELKDNERDEADGAMDEEYEDDDDESGSLLNKEPPSKVRDHKAVKAIELSTFFKFKSPASKAGKQTPSRQAASAEGRRTGREGGQRESEEEILEESDDDEESNETGVLLRRENTPKGREHRRVIAKGLEGFFKLKPPRSKKSRESRREK